MPAKRAQPKGPTLRQEIAARMAGRVKGAELSAEFGHACFAVEGRKIAGFITGKGAIAMKLPEARIAELVEGGIGYPLTMGKKTMREWVVVEEPESPATLKLLHAAIAFVASLPEKPARKKTAKKATVKRAKK